MSQNTNEAIEKLLASRKEEIAKLQRDLEERDKTIRDLRKSEAANKKALSESQLERQVNDAAQRAGANPKAFDDIARLAKEFGFKFANGALYATDPSGATIRSHDDPMTSMTIDEFVGSVLPERKPFLFGKPGDSDPQGKSRIVSRNDQNAIDHNIEEIAAGHVSIAYD